MKKIIISTSKINSSYDANALCTMLVAKELLKQGNSITIIFSSLLNEAYYKDGIKFVGIKLPFIERIIERFSSKNSLIRKIAIQLRRFIVLLRIYRYPNTSFSRSKKIAKYVEKEYRNNNVDVYLGTYRPYENLGAIKLLKKKSVNIIYGIYLLDIMLASSLSLNSYRMMIYLHDKSFEKIFNISDFILVAENGKKYYNSTRFDKFRYKIEYVGFPVLRNITTNGMKTQVKKDVIVITYAGTMDSKMRNPNYILKLISSIVILEPKIIFNMYGKYDDKKLIDKYTAEHPNNIFHHGTVEFNEIDDILNTSNILLNINNTELGAVPSKLFELIGHRKPIINIVKKAGDSSCEYLKKYTAKINIFEYEANFKEDRKKLLDFIFKYQNFEILPSIIDKHYSKFKPNHTANLIVDLMKKRSL